MLRPHVIILLPFICGFLIRLCGLAPLWFLCLLTSACKPRDFCVFVVWRLAPHDFLGDLPPKLSLFYIFIVLLVFLLLPSGLPVIFFISSLCFFLLHCFPLIHAFIVFLLMHVWFFFLYTHTAYLHCFPSTAVWFACAFLYIFILLLSLL